MQAEAAYQAAAQLVPALQRAITQKENGLSVLLCETPGAIPASLSLDRFALALVPVSLPAAVLRQRLDIAEAEARVGGGDHQPDAALAASCRSFTFRRPVVRAPRLSFPVRSPVLVT